jgi:flagellar operon protein
MTDPIRVNPVQSQTTQSGSQVSNRTQASGSSFADTLAKVEGLRFSNHAQKRLDDRTISLPEDGIQRLNEAVEKAKARGGKESLILMDDLALVVSIRNRVVITAVDANNRKNDVFTNIDSAVIVK